MNYRFSRNTNRQNYNRNLSRVKVSCPVAVETKPIELKVKKQRMVYSKDEILKFINTKPMPNDILLKLAKSFDCIEIKPVDLKWLSNKDGSHIKSERKFISNHQSKTIDLDWKFGSKLTKLVQHENSYLPPKLRKLEINDLNADLLEFERSMKSILNKMTPENFEICTLEIKNLKINSKEKLGCFVEQVFNKAIQEESYSKLYSKLTCKFNELCVDKQNFRSALLNKCQQTFKKGLDKLIEEVREFWMDKINKETNERMKIMYEESIEEQINKAKDKFFGNARFLSELYLANQLPYYIIFHVIKSYLKAPFNSVCIDSACKMIVVVGKNLQCENSKDIDELFSTITELSVSKDLDMKTRFKLKDVIDMKNRNWQLRQIQLLKCVVPKTLKEVQADKV